MNVYSNTLLHTQISFFGDYRFKARLENDQKYFRESPFWKLRITKLFTTKTNISPFINCIGYVLPKKEISFYKNYGFAEIASNILKAKSASNVHLVKQEYILAGPFYDICMISWTNLNENAADFKDIKQLSEVLDDEMDKIAKSVKYGDLNKNQNPFDIAETLFHSKNTGDYLSPIFTLNKLKERYYKDSAYKDLYLQTLVTYYSFLGDEEAVLRNLDLRFSPDSVQEKFPLNDFDISTDWNDLIKLMGEERVTMFNESHFQPAHRQMISCLLPQLKQKGYKYLAIEAIEEKAKTLTKRGFPTLQSGFYIRDFAMSNLIRQAISLGYILVNYESKNREKNREFEQATNLYKNTILKDPRSKVLVLAGHSHIDEAGLTNRKWMAEYFYEISGINPLTINQERFSNKNLKAGLDSSTFIVMKPKNKLVYSNDIYLINNYRNIDNGLIKNTGLQVKINLDFIKTTTPDFLLSKLYVLQEYESVKNPSPCFVSFNSGKSLNLVLSDGQYVLVIINNDIVVTKKLDISAGKVLYSDL